jgi:uncharacterized membrane protein
VSSERADTTPEDDEPAKPSRLGLVLAIVNGTLVGLYPVAGWVGLSYLSARAVGVIVMAFVVPMLAIRLRRADRASFWAILRIPLAILGLVTLGVVLDDPRYVLAMPVLINTVLLATFGATLRPGAMPMIERFARMQDPALEAPKIAHCRQFTWVWCVFFVLNGGTAAVLALSAPLSVWATYTGLVAYGLMGALFAMEYVVRKARFREYGPWPHDRALAVLFPPRTKGS